MQKIENYPLMMDHRNNNDSPEGKLTIENKRAGLSDLARLLTRAVEADGELPDKTLELVFQLKDQISTCFSTVDIEQTATSLAQRIETFLSSYSENESTKSAYIRAFRRFFQWCTDQKLSMISLEYRHVAAYIEILQSELSLASVRQNISAIRTVCDWLMKEGFLQGNPVPALKIPDANNENGPQTPCLAVEEIDQIFQSFDEDTVLDHRNRAMTALMLYAFIPLSSLVDLKMGDYRRNQKLLRLTVSGKEYFVPLHPVASGHLDTYLDIAPLSDDQNATLFPSCTRKRVLGIRPMTRRNVLDMLQHASGKAQLKHPTSPRQLRITGIVALMQSASSTTANYLLGGKTNKTKELYRTMAERQTDSTLGDLFDENSDPLREFIQKTGLFSTDDSID
ncbi:MAG: tyrosine-type recombinase/integrase [Candidatus Peribacteraceae bacterium]|nr:tyrosine-type recombinase/integrase [Candidatus Peribacteraceae bacterium]